MRPEKKSLDKSGDVSENESALAELSAKVAELRGGEFGVHVGYAPAFVDSTLLKPTKGREANIESAGSG